jgi:hypothetical protein
MYTPLQRKMLSIADELIGETREFIEVSIDDNFYYVYKNGDILMDTKEEYYRDIEEIIVELRKVEKRIINTLRA